jgi:hypothetical protein
MAIFLACDWKEAQIEVFASMVMNPPGKSVLYVFINCAPHLVIVKGIETRAGISHG